MLLSRSCDWLLAGLLSLPALAQTVPPVTAPLPPIKLEARADQLGADLVAFSIAG